MILKKISDKLSPHIDSMSHALWFRGPTGVKNNKKLHALKDVYKGKRCFIMGNGPSLLKCNLELLKNEITIVSNSHFILWDKISYIPTFLTVEDRLVAESRASEFNSLNGTQKIYPFDLAHVLKNAADTIFINFKRRYKPFPNFSDNFEKEVFWGGTVTFLNLQLAYYLGFSEIYLIGIDHSYKLPEKKESQVIVNETDDANHFDPNYFKKGEKWYDPNVARMEQAYVTAKNFLDKKGIKTYNATVGGMLEVFERINYENLFK